MADDLKRLEYTPGNYYNFHPGSHVGQGAEKGIHLIADLLNQVLQPEQTDYLYFVAEKDGHHRFTKTYAEHLKAIEEIG